MQEESDEEFHEDNELEDDNESKAGKKRAAVTDKKKCVKKQRTGTVTSPTI